MVETSKEFLSDCPDCRKATNHRTIAQDKITKTGDYLPVVETYMIVKCCGCNCLSFRLEREDAEDDQFDSGDEPTIQVETFPRYISGHRELQFPYSLPKKVKRIYEETISCLENGSLTLTAIGLRTVIEAIAIHNNLSGRDLDQKIKQFVKSGYLSRSDADRLHAIRFLGNDAAHDIKEFNLAQLITGLEIIEHILRSIYILALFPCTVDASPRATLLRWSGGLKNAARRVSGYDGSTVEAESWSEATDS